MDFRAILAFIVIAYISSILNKNKASTRPTDKTNMPIPKDPTRVPSNSSENKRKDSTGGLGELFQEMRTEFKRNYIEVQEKKPQPVIEQVIKKEDNIKTSTKDIKRAKGSVYEDEIGSEKINIEFNKRSIVQALIMSEILEKPKSLRR